MTEPATGREVTMCPDCGGAKHVPVGGTVDGVDSSAGGRMFRQPVFSILCCADCGLYFKSHTLPLRALNDYAAHLAFEVYEHEEHFPTDRIVQDILRRLPAGRKILDYGCNTGRILKRSTAEHQCFGIEINEPAAAIAHARGIQLITEEQLRIGRQRDFDVIILADVYEHLPQPIELLVQLLAALKSGGKLVLVTGNADAVCTRDRMAEFWYFGPPEHLLMMGERHVRWLVERLGVRLTDLYHCSHYDVPIWGRVKQYLQSYAYHQFRRRPRGAISNVLRMTPVFCRAEHWAYAPTLNYRADHFVAVFETH